MDTAPLSPSRQLLFYPAAGYAGFWKRFLAHLIDGILVGIAELIIILPLLAAIGLGAFVVSDEMSDPSPELIAVLVMTYILVILFAIIISWLYFALLESKKQATLGKMALGIIVTDMEGHPITFGKATSRYFSKIISSLTFGIGYVMAGFTQQKQALHDIISGCLVVNKPLVSTGGTP